MEAFLERAIVVAVLVLEFEDLLSDAVVMVFPPVTVGAERLLA
jgi:hypothetical protein